MIEPFFQRIADVPSLHKATLIEVFFEIRLQFLSVSTPRDSTSMDDALKEAET
jgi:hypothetical protein